VLATPRWIGWTLLAIAAVIVCGGMAYWQLGRAESPTGTLLNAGYALQWPLFAVFFAALWWRMLHAEARQLAALRGEVTTDDPHDADPDAPRPTPDGPAPAVGIPATPPDSPFTPRPAGVLPGDGQGAPVRGRARTDYNAMLAALARAEARERDETP
jgi:hypothetical protein